METRLARSPLPSAEQSITYPRPSELFSANANFSKREAIIAAVTRLAAAIKASYNEGDLAIYADTLEDVKPRVLELAFAEMEKTITIAALPTPGEIRELGTNLRADEWRKEEYRRDRERMAQLKAAAEADPCSDEELAELKKRVRDIVYGMDMEKARPA